MKVKVLTFAVIAIIVANTSGAAAADIRGNKSTKKVGRNARIVSLLPASDAVAVFDASRLLDDALPRVLSANQPMLARLAGAVSRIRERTGIDLRSFDTVAAGVAYKKVSATETDYEPLVIATSANLDFDALIAAGKGRALEMRSETVGGKTIFVFKPDPSKTSKKAPSANASTISKALDRVAKGFDKEVAAVALDKNTVAVGTLARVKETLSGRTRVAAELASLVSQPSTQILSFAMRPPGGMAKMLPLDNDELGKVIGSIQILSGTLDVNANGGVVHIAGKTRSVEEAMSLRDMAEVGVSFGKFAFINKKRPDQQVYGRMINNARIGLDGTSVTLDLTVPQADIDTLVATLK